MIAILFPGQGSQIVGMGSEFYNNFGIVKKIFQEADDKLNYKISKIILSESKITSHLVNARTTISKVFYFDKPIKESEKKIEKLIKDLES